jgi:hypothetical protein
MLSPSLPECRPCCLLESRGEVSDLSHAAAGEDPAYSRRMVTVLIEGLRRRPDAPC